jgi:type IV pilus assembly protein PilA
MKFWNKMKKNTKGFTLVEIIVVLVILAVLAAFTIPTMLGFVNESKGKAMIAEAREVYVAAQATATEYRAQYPSTDETDDTKGITDAHLQSALGSAETEEVTKAKALASDASVQTRVSYTMQNYLSEDFKPINDAADKASVTNKANPFWTVQLDTTTGTAKVDKIMYYRNGYTVTIEAGGGSTVVKD